MTKLNDTWVLWYHDTDSDWTQVSSYQLVCEFCTIEEFWSLYNIIPSVVDNFMFLMKKGHPPIWEAPENRLGGAWLYKVPKKFADVYWLNFSIYLVGNTIANDCSNLIGISLSPRVHNCTIKIWNNDSKKCQDMIEFNSKYNEFQHGQALYNCFLEKKN